MLLDFGLESATANYPCLRKGQFQKLTGGKALKGGELVNVTLRTSGGPNGPAEVTYPAVVAKAGDKITFRGWNDFLFDSPRIGSKVQHDVVAIAKEGKSSGNKVTTPKVTGRSSSVSNGRASTTTRVVTPKKTATKRGSLNKPTKTALKQALRANGGNKTKTAAQFGVHSRSLGRWLESYGLA